jgi:triphosphatase
MLRHLGKAIEERARALVGRLPGALAGDVDDAHRSRVAARRLAEVLPLLRGRRAERLRADVRHVRQALGARRELAVTLGLLADEARRWRWPASLVARVRRHLEATRPAIEADARRAARLIDIERLKRRLARVSAQAEAESYPALMTRLHRRRDARERALARAIASAGAIYDAERLHRVRIATKKLRYTLEAQMACAGRGPAARVRALKTLQDELGRLHDLQVLEIVVREVEGRFVSGRGVVSRGLARIGTDLETECRRLHALVLTGMRRVGGAASRHR